MALYRALLHLLPADRRRRDGVDMAAIFADLADERRREAGHVAVAALWLSEMAGLLRFSMRVRGGSLRRAVAAFVDAMLGDDPGPGLGREIVWAWRGLRTRGWGGVLIVALLALAMGANAIVFASADSFVLNRVPYRDADRLVEIGETHVFGWQASVWPELVPVWRKQTDLFADFQGYDRGGQIYLKGGDGPRYVAATAVTPGLLDMLGARPIWGRSFTNADAEAGADPVAIVAEDVAASEFGDARRALDQTLTFDRVPVRIVGVMPTVFRFPTGQERIWRPLDLGSIPPRVRISSIGRMATGQSLDTIAAAVQARAPALDSFIRPENASRGGPVAQQDSRTPPTSSTRPKSGSAAARNLPDVKPIAPALVDPRLKMLFGLLTGAAGCLLLVACANVINLELGAAVGRARTMAVSLALGASRPTLIRTALLEGALLIAAATALAGVLTWQVTAYIAAHLPVAMTNALPNPIHLNLRTVAFMGLAAAVTWLAASFPVAVLASRADVLDALKLDGRTLSTSRAGTRVRHLLTMGEVALTVLLLVGASLSVRTYTNLLNLPKGFDPASVITVSVRQSPSPPEADAALQERLLAALRARGDVVGAAIADASPPTMGGGIGGELSVGSEATTRGTVMLGGIRADADYFRTLRLPIVIGRAFEPGDPPEAVVVDEAFARRFWPAGDALGATFHVGGASFGTKAVMSIIGVAAHLRNDHDSVTQPSNSYYPVYVQQRTGDRYVPLAFVVRLAGGTPLESVRSMLTALAPTARIHVDRMTDRYAATFADEQLASSIMTAFGALAFVVAVAGVYGVMAFLVAARTREIGIRMALGADRPAVRRLILRSSMTPVLAGAVLGVVAAGAASHWARSLYFDVAATTPITVGLVALVVIATAAAATWPPARQAGRVDPSRLLRE